MLQINVCIYIHIHAQNKHCIPLLMLPSKFIKQNQKKKKNKNRRLWIKSTKKVCWNNRKSSKVVQIQIKFLLHHMTANWHAHTHTNLIHTLYVNTWLVVRLCDWFCDTPLLTEDKRTGKICKYAYVTVAFTMRDVQLGRQYNVEAFLMSLCWRCNYCCSWLVAWSKRVILKFINVKFMMQKHYAPLTTLKQKINKTKRTRSTKTALF